MSTILDQVGAAPKGLIPQYTKVALVFLLSGILHWIADRVIGVPWRESGAVHFFMLHAAGIIIEDAFAHLNRSVGLVTVDATLRRCGYGWLCLVLVLTTDTWMYLTARYVRPGQDVMLPVKIF